MARKKRPKVAKPRVQRKRVIAPGRRPEWKTKGLSLALSATDWMLAAVDGVDGSGAEGIVEQHSQAWERGQDPGSGQPHPPLAAGAAKHDADKGLRPNLRGVTNKPKGLAKSGMKIVSFFPRSPKGTPSRAKAVLSHPKGRPLLTQFFRDEHDEHGVNYLSVDGRIKESVEKNLRAFLQSMFRG